MHMGFSFADYRKQKEQPRRTRERYEEKPRERRPSLTSQEERFLYSLHLKTIEFRTLMATLKSKMTPSEFDQFIVDFNLRLRKARKNFDTAHWKDEWVIVNGKLTQMLEGQSDE
jgi:hypothetical protein